MKWFWLKMSPQMDTGQLLLPHKGGDEGWLPVRSKPVCCPVMKIPNYPSKDKMDKTHLCFTLSHGDDYREELGVWRRAFPSPGLGQRAPAHPYRVQPRQVLRPASLDYCVPTGLKPFQQDVQPHVLIPLVSSFPAVGGRAAGSDACPLQPPAPASSRFIPAHPSSGRHHGMAPQPSQCRRSPGSGQGNGRRPSGLQGQECGKEKCRRAQF